MSGSADVPPPVGTSPIGLEQPQRQSLFAVVLLAIGFVRGIGIVQLVIGVGFILSRSSSMVPLLAAALLVAVVALAVSTLGWWRFTFCVVDGELRVSRGVVSHTTLTVPLDRVQSVSVEAPFLHRIFGVVEVAVDTAGTSSAEFAIDAVSVDVAQALQAAAADVRARSAAVQDLQAPDAVDAGPQELLADPGHGFAMAASPSEAAPPAEERTVLQHDARRSATIALTQLPLSALALLAPLFAFGDDVAGWFNIDVPEVDLEVGRWLLWFVPLAIVGVVLLSIALNVVSVVVSEWKLTVTQTASGLRREAGLFSKRSVAAGLTRVQQLAVSQGPLERVFGFHHVTLHNVGAANFEVAGCVADEVADLRSLALDGDAGVDDLDLRVSPAQVFKTTRNTAVFCLLVTIALWVPLGPFALAALMPVPFTFLASRRSTRLRRWGLSGSAIADHQELLAWNRHETLLRKVNGVSVKQSLFERKRGLATVELSLSGGVLSAGSVSIGMIPLAEAQAVRDRALYVVETDRRAFM